MLSRASATAAALAIAALAATALGSVSSPAIGAATPAQWRCQGAPGYPASIPTSITVTRLENLLLVDVHVVGAVDTDAVDLSGTILAALTPFTGPTSSNPDASVSQPVTVGQDFVDSTGAGAALGFDDETPNKYVGYVPDSSVICASGTTSPF